MNSLNKYITFSPFPEILFKKWILTAFFEISCTFRGKTIRLQSFGLRTSASLMHLRTKLNSEMCHKVPSFGFESSLKYYISILYNCEIRSVIYTKNGFLQKFIFRDKMHQSELKRWNSRNDACGWNHLDDGYFLPNLNWIVLKRLWQWSV